jgi:hypothetical protein
MRTSDLISVLAFKEEMFCGMPCEFVCGVAGKNCSGCITTPEFPSPVEGPAHVLEFSDYIFDFNCNYFC